MCEGYVKIYRSVFEHGLFDNQTYSEREAWLWLISEAVFKPTRARVGNQWFDLERGQLIHSLSFFAAKWRWEKGKVFRFFQKLQSRTMIETKTERHATRLTICNYSQYQPSANDNRTISEREPEQIIRTERIIRKGKEERNARESRAPVVPSSDFPPDAFERFWALFPNKVGKLRAQQKLVAIGKRGDVSFADLMSGLERYVRKTDDRPWCNPETFLNQGRWADEPATNNRSRDPMSAAFDRLDERIAEKQGRPTGQDGGRDPSPFDGPQFDLTPEDGVSGTDWRLL